MANGGVNRDVETIVSPGFPALWGFVSNR
jgi:hypothetical protein